ncbi:hypothetical protein RRG08_002095 [Elysia crispata]|uniref:Uncharacterized protein n=1 Tax=Elysia crispata TaxID=231223 RepID=A0AAE1DHT3_9GAST|nr:hypothetical protein RRG08_002095 [Elysia crispata]
MSCAPPKAVRVTDNFSLLPWEEHPVAGNKVPHLTLSFHPVAGNKVPHLTLSFHPVAGNKVPHLTLSFHPVAGNKVPHLTLSFHPVAGNKVPHLTLSFHPVAGIFQVLAISQASSTQTCMRNLVSCNNQNTAMNMQSSRAGQHFTDTCTTLLASGEKVNVNQLRRMWLRIVHAYRKYYSLSVGFHFSVELTSGNTLGEVEQEAFNPKVSSLIERTARSGRGNPEPRQTTRLQICRCNVALNVVTRARERSHKMTPCLQFCYCHNSSLNEAGRVIPDHLLMDKRETVMRQPSLTVVRTHRARA